MICLPSLGTPMFIGLSFFSVFDAYWLGANLSNTDTLREDPSGRVRLCKLNDKLTRPLLFNKTILICLSIGLLLLSANVSQCIGEEHLRYESKEGDPCICNGTFFKSCPKASLCSENKTPQLEQASPSPIETDIDMMVAMEDDPVAFNHLDHPDHVNQVVVTHPMIPERSDHALPPLSDEDSKLDDTKQIVRHRKVYVAKRTKDREPSIHPLRLTIPVRVPDYAGSSLPDPKPVYKLRHYKTIDTRPEVKLVPVTKTIIKPKGVTSDQIIDISDEDKKVFATLG